MVRWVVLGKASYKRAGLGEGEKFELRNNSRLERGRYLGVQ